MRSIQTRLSLVAIVLSLATLWNGVGVAEAHHRHSERPRHWIAQLSLTHARTMIIHEIGPGTVLTRCRRFSPRVVGCDYQTPAINVGIEVEDPSAIFEGWATT